MAAHPRVAGRAVEVAITVPACDRALLIAVAWLHLIGVCGDTGETGFHPPTRLPLAQAPVR